MYKNKNTEETFGSIFDEIVMCLYIYIYIYICYMGLNLNLMCCDIDLLFPVVLCATSENIFRSIVMNEMKRRK